MKERYVKLWRAAIKWTLRKLTDCTKYLCTLLYLEIISLIHGNILCVFCNIFFNLISTVYKMIFHMNAGEGIHFTKLPTFAIYTDFCKKSLKNMHLCAWMPCNTHTYIYAIYLYCTFTDLHNSSNWPRIDWILSLPATSIDIQLLSSVCEENIISRSLHCFLQYIIIKGKKK